MHTTVVKVIVPSAGKTVEKTEEWTIHHNGDWSGDVIITAPKGTTIKEHSMSREIVIPASLLLQLAGKAALEKMRDELISAIEQIEFK